MRFSGNYSSTFRIWKAFFIFRTNSFTIQISIENYRYFFFSSASKIAFYGVHLNGLSSLFESKIRLVTYLLSKTYKKISL